VAPATFNTVNKWAAGISDTLALGILCEAYGMGIPTAVLKDKMVRAGQSSEKAALIYQHSDEEPQRDVAAGLDDMVRAERAKHHKDGRAHHKEKPTWR